MQRPGSSVSLGQLMRVASNAWARVDPAASAVHSALDAASAVAASVSAEAGAALARLKEVEQQVGAGLAGAQPQGPPFAGCNTHPASAKALRGAASS